MAARIRVLFVDRACEHLDRSHEQRSVLFGGALQILHELLQLLRHDVEGVGQFANFGAAAQLDALRKVAARNGSARFGKNLERVGDTACRVKAHHDARQHSQQRQQPRRMLHLEHGAVGFHLRLLHHDRPVQSHDRAVGAKHLGAFVAFLDRKIFGGGQLRLAALIHKVLHDLQVLHVLAGRVVCVTGGYEPTLRVDHIRR